MKIAYRIFTALILDSGIALTIGNSIAYYKAQLTGIGTDVLMHSAGMQAVTVPLEPIYDRIYAAEDMFMGMLLILLGFCLHALLLAREERNVPIKVVPRRLHSPRWFWIEMRIS